MKRTLAVALVFVLIVGFVGGPMLWIKASRERSIDGGDTGEITESQFSLVHHAEADIENAVDGNQDISAQLLAASEVAQKQVDQGLAEYFEQSYDSLTVRYAVGITYVLFGDYGETAVLSPGGTLGTFMAATSPRIKWNDVFSANDVVKTILDGGDFAMEVTRDEHLSIDYLKTAFKGKGLVYWTGHGGFSATLGPILLTGQKIGSGGLSADLLSEAVVETSASYYAITSKFIDKYYRAGDFQNTLFYFSSCHTGETHEFVNSLLAGGASTVLAYDFVVEQHYGQKMADTFFAALAQKNNQGEYVNDVWDSVTVAHDKNGLSDVQNLYDAYRSLFGKGEIKGAYLTVFGDYHFSLNDLVPPGVDSRDYGSLPDEVRGTWCSQTTDDKCINLADVLSLYDDPYFRYTPPDGSQTLGFISICTEQNMGRGQCDMTATILFEYFPVGVSWDCEQSLGGGETFEGCKPDYTAAHDPTQPRLRIVPNHQHGTSWFDTEPLYRVSPTTTFYGDISVLYTPAPAQSPCEAISIPDGVDRALVCGSVPTSTIILPSFYSSYANQIWNGFKSPTGNLACSWYDAGTVVCKAVVLEVPYPYDPRTEGVDYNCHRGLMVGDNGAGMGL